MYWTTVLCVGIVVVGEVSVTLYDIRQGVIQDVWAGWMRYTIQPVVGYVCILLMLYLALRYCINRKLYTMQAFVSVTGISALVFVTVLTHYIDGAIFTLYCFPVLVPLMYIDKRPLMYSFILNLSSYLLLAIAVVPGLPRTYGEHQTFIEVLTTALLIVGAHVFARLIMRVIAQVVDNLIYQTELSRRDPFTKLLNHTSFYEYLDKTIQARTEFSLIIWDIDDFKQINDCYGHNMGDQVIACFADILKENLCEDETAFRYGGEEFTVITRQKAEGAASLAEEVRGAFSKAVLQLPVNCRVTASSGVCEYDPALFKESRSLFAAADKALYQAKSTPGKNRACVWRQ